MLDILIKPVIIGLSRTPAEKILLACICQQSAQSGGHCSPTNGDLALAVNVHPQTVSDLINRLSKTPWLAVHTESSGRTLTPSAELMLDYYASGNLIQAPVEPTLSQSLTLYRTGGTLSHSLTPVDNTLGQSLTPPVLIEHRNSKQAGQVIRSPRFCPITNVDITHQPAEHKVATKATLQALLIRDRSRFDSLASRLLSSDQLSQYPYPSGQCVQLSLTARRLARAQAIDVEPEQRTPKLNERLCPITGVDIGRQRNDVRWVSGQTLERLARQHPEAFLTLATWLLPGEESNLTYPGSCSSRMAKVVRDLAASGLPIEPVQLPTRRCPVTNLDLSKQSPDYPYATASTLKKLFVSDRKVFDELASQFLTATEQIEDTEASQCRTLVYRVRSRAIQLYPHLNA